MKTHTAQTAWLAALALVFAVSASAQPNRGRGNRDYDNGRHNHDDYGYRHRGWENDRECDYGDRYDNRQGNGRYDYRPVVRYRPVPPPHIHRERQPSRQHVWMPGEYRWRNGVYVYYPGYWEIPPRPGMNYVPGYWQPVHGGGFVWISGSWNNVGFSVRF